MTSGHHTFDHTIQEANLWLKAVAEQLHFEERRHAYSALRATLHALRDRLTPDNAVHFGAQLPMVIRGLYFEGWRMAGKPRKDSAVNEFCAHISEELPPKFPMDPLTVSRGVFAAVSGKIDPGEIEKLKQQWPAPLRSLWPETGQKE